jgi:hypothetical protein
VGVLYDHFAAPDDAAAGSVAEHGPAARFDTVATEIDAVVLLGQLEELLGGRSFEEQLDDPRAGGLVEERDGGERLVLTISPGTQTAPACAPDADVPRIARAWAEAEEFGGAADPAELESTLGDLCSLARRAGDASLGLYCWVSV